MLIEDDQTSFTGPQIAELRRMGMTHASAGDLQVFFDYAKRYGLDPFTEGIAMVGRHGRQYLQTDLGGFLTIARTVAGDAGVGFIVGSPEYQTPDSLWWLGAWPFHERSPWGATAAPAGVRLTVEYGSDGFEGVAWLVNYLAVASRGEYDPAWLEDPATWLTNIATALALRRAMPEALGFVYLHEEMRQADMYAPSRAGSNYGTLRRVDPNIRK